MLLGGVATSSRLVLPARRDQSFSIRTHIDPGALMEFGRFAVFLLERSQLGVVQGEGLIPHLDRMNLRPGRSPETKTISGGFSTRGQIAGHEALHLAGEAPAEAVALLCRDDGAGRKKRHEGEDGKNGRFHGGGCG